MPLVRVSNWNGISERRDGTLSQLMQGFAFDAVGVDTISRPGQMFPFHDVEELTFDEPADEFRGMDAAGIRLFSHGLAGLWEFNFGLAEWERIAGTAGGTAPVKFLDDRLYYGSAANFLRYGPLSGVPTESTRAVLDDNLASILAKNSFIWAGRGSGGTASSPSVTSDDGTVIAVDDLRLFPPGGDAVAIGETPDLLLIGVRDRVYVWDMFTAEGWNFDFPVDGHVQAFAYSEGISYIITTMAVYAYFQGERNARKMIDLPVQFRGDNEQQWVSVLAESTSEWSNHIIFGTNNLGGSQTVTPYGWWAFPKFGVVQNPRLVKFRSQFETSVQGTGAYVAFRFQDDVPSDTQLHLSETDEVGTRHAYRIRNTNDRQDGTWTSQWIDFGFPDFDKEIYKLEIVTEQLPVGTSVTIETATNYGTSFTTQLTHDVTSAVQREIGVRGVRGRRIQFRISLNSNGTSFPVVTDMIIGYRVFPRTV